MRSVTELTGSCKVGKRKKILNKEHDKNMPRGKPKEPQPPQQGAAAVVRVLNTEPTNILPQCILNEGFLP